MRKIVKENQTFEKALVSRDEAMAMAQSGRLAALAERDTPSQFKIDLLDDIPEDEEISIFKNGDFWDLCAGPHVPRTGNCKAFKVMSVAAAFYKGDAANPQLQRVYGTAFKNKTELDEYLERSRRRKARPPQARQGARAVPHRRSRRPGPHPLEAERCRHPPRAAEFHLRN